MKLGVETYDFRHIYKSGNVEDSGIVCRLPARTGDFGLVDLYFFGIVQAVIY